MNLPTEIFGEVIVVHSPQEVASEQADPLIAYLPTLERRNVVLDLDATEMFDSRGLEALRDTQDRLREAGGELKLCTTNPVNRKILDITRLDQQLEVFENVIDAVRSFR
jgi:anti-sigma B factor antagonist